MSVSDVPVVKRRAKRLLSAEQKYDLWQRMLTGQITTAAAAAGAGVDRTTIMTLRKVARDGAIAALTSSRPGRAKRDRVEESEKPREKLPHSARQRPCT